MGIVTHGCSEWKRERASGTPTAKSVSLFQVGFSWEGVWEMERDGSVSAKRDDESIFSVDAVNREDRHAAATGRPKTKSRAAANART